MVNFHKQTLDNRPVEAGSGLPFFALCRRVRWIAFAIAVALAYGWIQGETLQVSYRTAGLERENKQLQALVSALRVEHSALTTPDLIDRQARTRGFVRFDQVEVVEAIRPLAGPGQMLMAENRR